MSDISFSKVLVGGPPSSGSTLLSVMLDSHPEVFCGPETNIVAHPGLWKRNADIGSFLDLPGTPVPIESGSTWARPSSAGLAYHLVGFSELKSAATRFSTATQLLDYALQPRMLLEGKSVACEKSPPNIYATLPALELDPDLKAIICIRNGPDVIRSLLRRKAAVPVAVLRWLSKMNLAVAARDRYGDRALIVRYEDLTSNPLSVAEEICAFLGVRGGEFAEAMVNRRASRRIGVDSSISGEIGAAAAWRFKPHENISARVDDADTIPPQAAALLNELRLKREAMEVFGMTTEPMDAHAVSRALGYEPNWKQGEGDAQYKLTQSTNRLMQFCFEIAEPRKAVNETTPSKEPRPITFAGRILRRLGIHSSSRSK
ncbi:sulfotransferase family protein [Thauera sp. 63]|uniref:sulfotransferase family protein n=1 Tax=Thauera sp. 63 TaxID=497321 RepID=UPI0009F8CDEA|nr:sulfotransferase [Thauera sp. 63]